MENIALAKAAACFGAAIAISLGTLGPALAQGMVGARACENMGKYAESASKIQNAIFMTLAFIETSSIYALLISGALLYIALSL